MVQIYTGDGKGKTTASIGAAIRAASYGIPVAYCQFLKDGSSGEIRILSKLSNVDVFVCREPMGFVFQMSEEEKEEAKIRTKKVFEEVKDWYKTIQLQRQNQMADISAMIVLDEVMAGIST
ncbi:MAG: cob(I)yrinic acid a,c-diamide adenosyltransferase, partial [Lachnospiraceae bacterium]|nr:cob(I)yrinic acid a,c-diamide adenosyltransferase [Lachnospiraceae bacterium]